MQCIYCSSELVGKIRPAHVVPEGMGGRLTSTTTVCNDCNNSFCGIEGDACRRLAAQSAMLGGLRGDREPITATVELNGVRYRAAGGRIDELAPPPMDRGTVWPMPARREDQVGRIVSALRARRLPPEALLDGRFILKPAGAVPSLADVQTVPVESSFIWGDRVTKRVMTKVAVEFLAHLRGDEARRPELYAARRFARYDDGELQAGVDTSTGGARLPLVSAPFVHGIDVWSSGTFLNYRMILYTEVRFAGSLTNSWQGTRIRCGYSFDIREPSTRRVDVQDGDGPPLVNKSRRVRERELEVALARVEALNFATAERRTMRAPAPSAEDLYPDVAQVMAED